MKPADEYQRPIRRACSDVFHHEDVMTINPGLRGASNTPRKNRPMASPVKLVAAPEQARATPGARGQREVLDRRCCVNVPLTPQDEVHSQVFAGGKFLHQVVGRVFCNQIPNVKQGHQQAVMCTLEVRLVNHAIRRCSTKCLEKGVSLGRGIIGVDVTRGNVRFYRPAG